MHDTKVDRICELKVENVDAPATSRSNEVLKLMSVYVCMYVCMYVRSHLNTQIHRDSRSNTD
jgi:hypothetical protein